MFSIEQKALSYPIAIKFIQFRHGVDPLQYARFFLGEEVSLTFSDSVLGAVT